MQVGARVAGATMRLIVSLALTAPLGSCSSSSPAGPKKPENVSLSAQVDRLVRSCGIPGAVGIVMDGDTFLDTRASGLRFAGGAVEVSIDDLFHIGSNGKSMTATMIARLVEEGALSWNSRPADVIPGVSDSLDPGYADVTILDLLRHRGGVPADEDFSVVPEFCGTLAQQRLAASRWVLKQAPAVPRGTYRYSNAGYMIAGCIAEAAAGQDWRTLMDTKFFAPLGIEVCYGWPMECDMEQPWGHEKTHLGYEPVDPSVMPASLIFLEPAGFISMSIGDLAKFMRLHMDAQRGNPRLLGQASFDTLQTPVGDYACGLGIVETGYGTLLWHSGSNGYFFAVMYMLPENNIGVAVAVNAGDDTAGAAVHAAAEKVLLGLVEGGR